MPELAEVEVVRRNLESWWLGNQGKEVRILDQKLESVPGASRLESLLLQAPQRLFRRGKYLFAEFADGVVLFHFRMTGKITLSEIPEPRFARLAWLVEPSGWLVFKDQRRFGDVEVLSWEEYEAYEPLLRMGPEPEDLTVEDLQSRISKRKMLKSALLDQSVVAGVGNIAISELFWRSKIPPEARGADLSLQSWENLVLDMPAYFQEVIEQSMADEIDYLGEAGNTENIFAIYGREGEPCPRCAESIQKSKVGGRSSYWCPACQG